MLITCISLVRLLTKVKVCELCGSEFICRGLMHAGICWCAGIRVSGDSLRRLSEMADDCVCPDCLRRISRGAEESGQAKSKG